MKRHCNKGQAAGSRGFSLIELLLAMAIVSILMITLFNLINNTALITQNLTAHLQAGAEVRTALDRMSADFTTGVFRSDISPHFDKKLGNDAFYFYATADGYGGDRGVSKIGYRIENGQLVRGSEGTGWSSGRIAFATELATDPFVTAPSGSSYDVLGERIFRIETEFLMSDGTYRSASAPGRWQDVRSVIVTVAIIEAQALLRASGALEDLADLFPDPPEGSRAIDTWSALLVDSAFLEGDAEFPASSRKGINVRQRVFPMPK